MYLTTAKRFITIDFFFITEAIICLLVESIEKSVDPILGVLYTWKVWFCPTSTSVIRTWYTELDRGEFSCTVTGVDRGRLEITGAEFIPATSFNYIFLIRLFNTCVWKYMYLLMWLYDLGVPTLYKKCFRSSARNCYSRYLQIHVQRSARSWSCKHFNKTMDFR